MISSGRLPFSALIPRAPGLAFALASTGHSAVVLEHGSAAARRLSDTNPFSFCPVTFVALCVSVRKSPAI